MQRADLVGVIRMKNPQAPVNWNNPAPILLSLVANFDKGPGLGVDHDLGHDPIVLGPDHVPIDLGHDPGSGLIFLQRRTITPVTGITPPQPLSPRTLRKPSPYQEVETSISVVGTKFHHPPSALHLCLPGAYRPYLLSRS